MSAPLTDSHDPAAAPRNDGGQASATPGASPTESPDAASGSVGTGDGGVATGSGDSGSASVGDAGTSVFRPGLQYSGAIGFERRAP